MLPLNGPVDYRLERLGGMPTWHVPIGAGGDRAAARGLLPPDRLSARGRARMSRRTTSMSRRPHAARAQEPQGRRRVQLQAAVRRGARRGRLSRDRARYHTVILVGIPRAGPEKRNEAARFVTLIDALYEHKVKLLATADAEPEEPLSGRRRRASSSSAPCQPADGNAVCRISRGGPWRAHDPGHVRRTENCGRMRT